MRGVSAPANTHSHGPFVTQGRIEGLSRIDRLLLDLLFDRIAKSDHFTLGALRTYSSEQPWSYWTHLREWRSLVRERTGASALTRTDALRMRRGLLEQIEAGKLAAMDIAAAVALGLARRLGPRSFISAGRVAPLVERFGRRSGVVELKHALSPLYPLGERPPARIGFSPPAIGTGAIVGVKSSEGLDAGGTRLS